MNQNQLAEIQISYSAKVPFSKKSKVVCSRDAYILFVQHWNKDTINLYEEFKVLLLNRAKRCIGFWQVSKGGTAGTVVDCKLVFATALKCNASYLVLGHNHPSGSLFPSQQDIILTKKLVEAGKLLDVQVIDHIIVTEAGYYSFADEGKI